MKKLLFVFNPRSGKAQIKNKLLDIIDIFVKGGYSVTVHPTQKALDCYRLIKKTGSEYDLIVSSGGDGTLNESVRGLLKLENMPLLGYIPAGTTNDFATSIGIPKDFIDAAKSIVNGKPFACDIGQFNENFFTYVAAFGIFTDVSYQTSQNFKNAFGHLAYILEGIKRLGSIKSYEMMVEHDGVTIKDEFLFGMVANTNSIGGYRGLSELNVSLCDGEFEVLLIRNPKNAFEVQGTINALLTQDINSEHLYFFRTSDVKFYSEEYVPWTLDGENGGNHTEVNVKNLHRAINIIIKDKK